MKPAYTIDLGDTERALLALRAMLDRDAARSRSMVVTVPQPLVATLTEESFVNITTPSDQGTTIRSVRLIPAADYRISRLGASVLIGVGIRSGDRFQSLGREWSSKAHALTAGSPFDLVTTEQVLRAGYGLALRVTRTGWPATWPTGASVEATIGYDPGA